MVERRGVAGVAGAAALVALCAVLPFLPALGNGFIWDDHLLIERNAVLEHPFASFCQFVSVDSQRTPYYRPVSMLWWSLLRVSLGLGPVGFHASNLLLHAAVSILLLLIARRVLDPAPAFAAGLLFAVHPIHVEPVVFASAGATELLPSALFLAALYAMLPPADPSGGPGVPRNWRAWTAAGLSLLAMLSKESAIVFPAVAAVALLDRRTCSPGGWRLHARLLIPFGIALTGYLSLRAYATSQAGALPIGTLMKGSAAQLPAWFLAVAAGLIAPWRLLPYYDLPESGVLGVALAAAMLGAAAFGARRLWKVRRGGKEVSIGLALLLFPILPALPLVPRQSSIFAERFLYLPSSGFCILVAVALALLGGVAGRRRRTGAAFLVLCAAAGTWTFLNVDDWRDESTLFSRALDRDPGNEGLLHMRGVHLLHTGKPKEARVLLEAAHARNPAQPDTRLALAECLGALGERLEAERMFRALIADGMAVAESLIGIGNLKFSGGRGDKGEAEFLEAAKVNPRRIIAHLRLGEIAVGRGDFVGATAHWERGLALDPMSPELLNNLGVVAMRRGDYAKARDLFRRTLAVLPGNQTALANLAALPP